MLGFSSMHLPVAAASLDACRAAAPVAFPPPLVDELADLRRDLRVLPAPAHGLHRHPGPLRDLLVSQTIRERFDHEAVGAVP